jgi:hypothetical protein
MRGMLTELLMIVGPILWLTLTALVLAACRAAASADAVARQGQHGELEPEIVLVREPSGVARGVEVWRLAARGHRS